MTTKKSNPESKRTAKKTPLPKNKTTSAKTTTKAAPDKKVPTSDKAAPEKAKNKIGLQLNWNRAIHIDTIIDDTLLKILTPIILKLRQDSTNPITIGIDSPGGSIASMQSLLGLLQAPDQDGNRVDIYTVSTNRTYSAAASLLAFGDYAVAFPHSKILYHDLRYSGIEDLTPSKALRTARELERGNVEFSLTLANQVSPRLIWVYLDLFNNFEEARKSYPLFAEKQDTAFADALPADENRSVDIVGFALTLFRKLSNPIGNDIAIGALHLLNKWNQIDKIERRLLINKEGKGESTDFIKGITDLVTEIRAMDSGNQESVESPEPTQLDGLSESARIEIKLLFEVIARRFASDKNLNLTYDVFDSIMDDFAFIKDINSKKHVHTITRFMIQHDYIFFKRSIATELNNANDETERSKILDPLYPQARMLWFYIVSICRCLCSGEHFLTPYDAQLLGLVDEVLGGGLVVSRREWRKKQPDYVQTSD
ncbi:MAG: ATP-dependent Clp protease proteolytic subunit [Deltaproteobacteria bacterium]|nr:ATP-dependent Clp protease proteolytic subunit [Deltaproteobacteria bacterium]